MKEYKYKRTGIIRLKNNSLDFVLYNTGELSRRNIRMIDRWNVPPCKGICFITENNDSDLQRLKIRDRNNIELIYF